MYVWIFLVLFVYENSFTQSQFEWVMQSIAQIQVNEVFFLLVFL